MKSGWVDREAALFVEDGAKSGIDRDLALRVYTTRLLGRDPKLVLHGGGNTSLKTRVRDLFGEEAEVLHIKASGGDMATIEPAGLPAVRLAPLRKLRALDAIADEDLVAVERANLIEPAAPNPSVEIMLHAFLPHKFVDHTHATRGAQHHRPAERRRKMHRGVCRPAGFRALPHAGLRPRQEGHRGFRTRQTERRPHSQQARHRHFRRQRARGLRAHDRDGVGRRRFYRAASQERHAARAKGRERRRHHRGRADRAWCVQCEG